LTVSTQSSSVTVAATNGVGPYAFSFIGVSASDITVSSVASNGAITPLLSSQYSISLNAANPNSLWGAGGSVTLNSTPSYPNLLIARSLPLTQQVTTQNQGNYYAQVTEQALDMLEMQIQQVSARTTQFLGTWITNTNYLVGVIVQDGVNGANTGNYYICQVQNTSGVWATDLANGDWALSALAAFPSTPINISGAVTGVGTTNISTTLANEAGNTILANTSATSGAPTGYAITSMSQLFGRGTIGNLSAISLGNNLSMTGTVLNAASFSGGGSSGLVVGGTSISSGNPGNVLAIGNTGILGQIGVIGTGSIVCEYGATISGATLISPIMGTPQSGNLVNCTNIPASLMTALGIGSIILAIYNNSNAISVGGTISASNLIPVGFNSIAGANQLNNIIQSGDSITGTWRTLQSIAYTVGNTVCNTGLWQRTA